MIMITDKALCCGCGACEQVCPKRIIQIKADAEGFYYPVVNEEECVHCNLCSNVCPIGKYKNIKEIQEPVAFGGWHKNENIRYDSSSGGAFTLLAEGIIAEGGVVFGCVLDSEMHAQHTYVERIEDLYKLRGSKYVQSEIGCSFSKVKDFLAMGRKVLFVGTPCQAAGLYSFMGGKSHRNLYIVDFICHGVPSPSVFKAFVSNQESISGSKMISHRFRNKDHGWNQTGMQLGTYSRFENGKEIRRYPALADSFMNGFLDDIYLRPSCYECQFKIMPKEYADFTIADFWGVDRIDSKNLNDKKGTSLILLNTSRARDLWAQVRDNFFYEEVDFESAIRRNKSLIESVPMNVNRNRFFSDFRKKGFKYVEKKYMSAFIYTAHKIIKYLASQL